MRTFQWAYGSAPLGADTAMTTERAAKMVRSWRNHGYIVTRIRKGLIRCQAGGLVATMSASSPKHYR